MFEPDEILQSLNGRGSVSAPGIDAVRIRYRLVIERREGAVRARGSLNGPHAALRPVWLSPDATLQLKDGRCLGIALTDLVGEVAEFESTGPVPRG